MCAWPGCDEGHTICNPHWRKLSDDERWTIHMACDAPFYGSEWGLIDGNEKMRVRDAPGYSTWNTAEGAPTIVRILQSFEFHTTIEACCAQAEDRRRRRDNGRLQPILDRTNAEHAAQDAAQRASAVARIKAELAHLPSEQPLEDDGDQPIGGPPCS